MEDQKDISKHGYKDDSPYKDRPYLDIHTPNGIIDMTGVSIPLLANNVILGPNSGLHKFDTTMVREIPMAQDGKETSIDLQPQIDILIERINSPGFKEQVYAQYENMHGYKPDWDWDTVIEKQIKLIKEGGKDATYDASVMTPFSDDVNTKKGNSTMVAGMQNRGKMENMGKIMYNPEAIEENPEGTDLTALHELTHRMNALEPTELTPYLNLYIEGEYGNVEGKGYDYNTEKNYLESMLKYGSTYLPEINDEVNDFYSKRSKNYNFLGNYETSGIDPYYLEPSEGHGHKTVLQEELKGLGIHDFNAGVFDDAALERLYNMSQEDYNNLSEHTQKYLAAIGVKEIIFPDTDNKYKKWVDEKSVEEKKKDSERKDNIFQYMNEFWGDATDEIGGDDLVLNQQYAKYGGSVKQSPYDKEKLALKNQDGVIADMMRNGAFLPQFKMGSEKKIETPQGNYTIKKDFDKGRNLPYVNYKHKDIDDRVYYDKDDVDGSGNFQIIDIAQQIHDQQRAHKLTKKLIKKYREGDKLSHSALKHLSALGMIPNEEVTDPNVEALTTPPPSTPEITFEDLDVNTNIKNVTLGDDKVIPIDDQIALYMAHVSGAAEGTPYQKKLKRIYDKLNRVYYQDSKKAGLDTIEYMKSLTKS